MTGAGVFAVFLFLTYFMQVNLAFSPLKTGLAFLPLTVVLVITSTTVQTRVIERTGVKPLVLLGMALGVIGMVLFAQLTPTSNYGTGVLPGLLVRPLELDGSHRSAGPLPSAHDVPPNNSRTMGFGGPSEGPPSWTALPFRTAPAAWPAAPPQWARAFLRLTHCSSSRAHVLLI